MLGSGGPVVCDCWFHPTNIASRSPDRCNRADSDMPASQSPVWHQLGMNADEPEFLPNPRYWELPVDLDLLAQERLRHAGQLRERFLPLTRWFTGRHRALNDLAVWLYASGPGSSLCVITGNAGSGKTALLGLIAALSDPDYAPGVSRQGLPPGSKVPDSAITLQSTPAP